MQVLWLWSIAVAATGGSRGVEREAPGYAVYADSRVPPPLASQGLYEVSESSQLLDVLPRPGKRRLRSLLQAMGDSIREWFAKAPAETDRGRLRSQDRRLQPGTAFPCRPSRRPGVYGRVPSLPPQTITECVPVATEEVFGVNNQIVDITFGRIGGLEVLMITQRRGPVRYLEVYTQGDYAHYAANPVALKTFRDHSCLNREEWCFVSQVKPIDAGLLVVDRHRLIHYNYTWLADGDTLASEIPDVYVAHFGQMNADEEGKSVDDKLKFPTAVAEYQPYNSSFITLDAPAIAGVTGSAFPITSQIPHAWCRLLFVTDTGNHRVVMLNASNIGQFDVLGQYGITGEARDNSTGFNWPWGIAVVSPVFESRYEPTYASVLVVDRRNHRLVKLNLGYPLMPCELDMPFQVGPLQYDEEEQIWLCRRYDQPRLSWAAEYGKGVDEFNRPRGLTDPTAVAVYKHYIVVAEVAGNALTLLSIDHHPPYGFKFVTYFKPAQGVSLQGGMSMSPFGYIWYTYTGADAKFYFTSMFLPESLRESEAPNRFQDFLDVCVNISWYDNLILQPQRYIDHVSFILNASVINWISPDEPDFVDLQSFNKSGFFDLQSLNRLVYNYTMQMCDPPPTSTPPPFFQNNDEDLDSQRQSGVVATGGTHRSSPATAVLFTCCISALWLLASLQL